MAQAGRQGSRAGPACGREALARYFRVLGDPTRLRIAEALLEGERTVSELAALLAAPQSRVSNHLACLKWCRVAEAERRGRGGGYPITHPRGGEGVGLARALAPAPPGHLAPPPPARP